MDTRYDHKVKVWMNKKTGQLVEYFPTCLGGCAIAWDFLADTPIIDSSPLMFDDDENFDVNDYEELGEL